MCDGFEILDHTADIGLRAFGGTLPELYENAARGMLGLMARPRSVRPVEVEAVEVEADDAVGLLITWLHEILFRFDARGRVFAEVEVEELTRPPVRRLADRAGWRLRGKLKGEPLDLSRHELGHEIKAVTYHGARVEREGDRWVAEVLFDI